MRLAGSGRNLASCVRDPVWDAARCVLDGSGLHYRTLDDRSLAGFWRVDGRSVRRIEPGNWLGKLGNIRPTLHTPGHLESRDRETSHPAGARAIEYIGSSAPGLLHDCREHKTHCLVSEV